MLYKKIIIVENDKLTAQTNRVQLESRGYDITHISSGEAAVDFFKNEKNSADLILMDIDLGSGMDGTEAADIILKQHDIPLIFLSSHTEPETAKKIEKITAYGYVVKNTGITALETSIKMAFRLYDAQQEIKLKEREYSSLFNEMLNGFALHEMIFKDGKPTDYRFLDINNAFEQLTGLKAENLIGKTVKEVLPETENYWIETYGEVTTTGKSLTFSNYSKVLDRHYEITAFRPAPGQFACFFSDITDHINIQNALKESEERFKALHYASFEGIAIHDLGRILECNQGLANCTGYSMKELIGMDGLKLIIPEDRDLVMDNIINKYSEAYEAGGLRKDGSTYPIRLHARNIPYKGKRVRVTEFRDITEQKNNEKMLQEAYNEKDALLKELQHRAKNSFNTISALIQLKKNIITSEEAKEAITDLHLRVQALSELYSLLHESGEPNLVNLKDYFNRIINSLTYMAEGIDYEIQIDSCKANTKNAATLGLILTELMTNSIKYAFPNEEKGVIAISFTTYRDSAVLKVTDNGIGYSDDSTNNISSGMGFILISSLCSQIESKLETCGRDGACAEITIPAGILIR